MSREVRFNYAGARVLVTGGSNGIGLAIAEAYARSGAEVSITGTAGRISDYPQDLSGFKYHSLDMRDGTPWMRLSHESANWMCSSTAQVTSSGVREDTPSGFEESVRVNLFGTQRACLAGFAGLAARKGSVIKIASMSSYFGFPRVPGYGASKTAIVSLTKSWRCSGPRTASA